LPLALGNALAARVRGSDAVTVVFFGDGAVQAGHFHESVNLAALWELSLVFVCENNGFAEFTPRSAHTVVERVSDVVAPYGFERRTVDGGDVRAVYEAFGDFLAAARRGRGPMLLECLTHRRRGHYEGDQQTYRDPAAEAEWERLDPIARLRDQARQHGWLDEHAIAELERAARAEVDAAVEFSRASPFPEPESARRLVYAE
jgi:pyruvate dehydrogenase E1 component alpha subunit